MSESSAVPFKIRPYAGESNFVAGTWMQSYRGSRHAKSHTGDEYFDYHAPVVNSLIQEGVILIAEHTEHADLLLGHCVVDRNAVGAVLHYCYVKGDYRQQGIGKALWTAALEQVGGASARPGSEVRYTHKMPGTVWGGICKRNGWVYNQYLAYRYNPWRHAA